jgi:hypothetical protein
MDIITLENLTRAIVNRIGIDLDEAQKDAGFILDIFGFEDRVIDNILDPEDRQLFYILQEGGMLTTEREECILHDGREWRTHYWRLRRDKILQYSRVGEIERKYIVEKSKILSFSEDDIYNKLDENIWTSRKNNGVYI